MARGGRRAATPGAKYGNRTDLQQRAPLPVTTGPSQQYGQASTLAAQQKALPIAPQPLPTAPTATPAAAFAGPQPGSFGPALRPTEQPAVPVTTGLPFGPGAGPEANTLPPIAPSPLQSGLAMLNSLGDHLPPVLQAVRDQASALSTAGIQ